MKGNAYVPFMLRRGDGSTLSLDFTAMGGTLDSRFTFTRSTTATFINSSGYVTSAAINAPRFDYDPTTLTPRGLLVEGSATNLLKHSTYADTSWIAYGGYSKSYTTNISSPANDTSAARVTFSAVGNGLFTNNTQMSYTNTVGATYTFSAWIRATSNTTNLNIRFGDSAVANGPNIPITTTWTRYSYSYVAVSASGPAIQSASGTATGEFEMWGFQLEAGSSASAYIPTTTSAVQRTADTCIAASTGFSSWFTGGTIGTFYADWYGGLRGITSTVRTVLSTSDVSARHLHLQQTAAAGNLKIADFGAANVVTTSNSITSGARTKGAFSFSGGTVNLTLNGGTVATSSSLAFSTAPTWLVVGGTSTDGSTITDGTVVLNGSIRAIKYWPSVLPTATLQSLTT